MWEEDWGGGVGGWGVLGRVGGGGGGGGGTPRKIGWGVRPTSQNPYSIGHQNLQLSLPYL